MKILLIEPNYANKYPPLGLMKLATYHKQQGHEVTFFKGDIKTLEIQALASSCIKQWQTSCPEQPLHEIPVHAIWQYISRGLQKALLAIKDQTNDEQTIASILAARQNYRAKTHITTPEWKWDRVYVTTLFTFYWDKIIHTITHAKKLVKNIDNLYVGGVAATILTERMMQATQLARHNFLTGLLDRPGIIDPENPTIIDHLSIDYTILDEINHQYKEHGNYYGYMTRGCVNKCPFCIVPVIEPHYIHYIPLTQKIEQIRTLYGEQKNLLLLDNNVMASESYATIINEIKQAGFHRGAKYTSTDTLTLNINHIKNGHHDRGRIIKTTKLLLAYLHKHPEGEVKNHLSALYTANNIFADTYHLPPTPQNLITTYQTIAPEYLKTYKPTKTNRYVDFNQGVDARLITDEKMALLSQIAIKPLRIAFDSWHMEKTYTKAIKSAAKHGIKHLSNYLLYNFKDKPAELYARMKHNVDLGKQLGVQIFSFPMKYHPVSDTNYYSNRTYMGQHWNRKYIRAIQLVLNATKGKVSPNPSFFYHAFGKNEKEFQEILLMPDHYILYRMKNTQNGNIEKWRNDYQQLSDQDKEQANAIIHTNHFNPTQWEKLPLPIQKVLMHYCG